MDGVCILPYAYALSFFFGWQVNGQHVVLNLFRVKLMEMLLSWDSLFNHAKGLHHLWRSLPLLQKEMLLRMKKVTVLKRILSSVLGNVSFCSFVIYQLWFACYFCSYQGFLCWKVCVSAEWGFICLHNACSIATKEARFTSTEAIFPKSKGGVTQASTWSIT